MISEAAFHFFAAHPQGPHFTVEEVAENPEHQFYKDVIEALKNVDDDAKTQALEDQKFTTIFGAVPRMGVEKAARIRALTLYLCRTISVRRREILAKWYKDDRPPPYDHPALDDIEFSNDFLVPLSAFDSLDGALRRNGFTFIVCTVTPLENSSYWLSVALNSSDTRDRTFVRLDPFLFGPNGQFFPMSYRMRCYGVDLDWNRLSALPQGEYGRWMPDFPDNTAFTDFVWTPGKEEIQFLCEELPDSENVETRGSRYLHAIYKPDEQVFDHLDGAVRYYSKDELAKRQQTHVRHAGSVGTRIKIFRIDGSMSRETFCKTTPSFFVWNEDVGRYFAGN